MFHASQGKVNETLSKKKINTRSQWFTPMVLAIQETKIGRIVARCHPRQIS
jgi:hypothetical protein